MLYFQTGEQIHVSLPLSQQVSNESRLSMSESVSEFFDAQEVLLSASSSENEVGWDSMWQLCCWTQLVVLPLGSFFFLVMLLRIKSYQNVKNVHKQTWDHIKRQEFPEV